MPMYRMDVILLNKHKDNVITALHKAGVTEIDFLEDRVLKENDVARDRPLERATDVSKNIIRTNRILGSLKQLDVSKVSFLEGMLGVEKIAKADVSAMNNEKILKESSTVLSEIEPVVFEVVDKLEILNSEESEITKNLAECKLCPPNCLNEYRGRRSAQPTLLQHCQLIGMATEYFRDEALIYPYKR